MSVRDKFLSWLSSLELKENHFYQLYASVSVYIPECDTPVLCVRKSKDFQGSDLIEKLDYKVFLFDYLEEFIGLCEIAELRNCKFFYNMTESIMIG